MINSGGRWGRWRGTSGRCRRDGLGFFVALLAEPHGDVERARAVVAEDGDGLFFVELVVSAAGDFSHGHEPGAGDAGGVELPLLADVEEKGRFFGGEELLELVDGDFVVHGSRITRGGCESW
jgi:hypothetical protein